jgi:hypothetical protein
MYKVQHDTSYQPDFLSQWNLSIKVTLQCRELQHAICLSTTEVIKYGFTVSSFVKGEMNAYWKITDSVPTNDALGVDDGQ